MRRYLRTKVLGRRRVPASESSADADAPAAAGSSTKSFPAGLKEWFTPAHGKAESVVPSETTSRADTKLYVKLGLCPRPYWRSGTHMDCNLCNRALAQHSPPTLLARCPNPYVRLRCLRRQSARGGIAERTGGPRQEPLKCRCRV